MPNTQTSDFKKIVIDTTTGIIERYIADVKAKGTDTFFIEKLEVPNKTTESCINHIMNNLAEKRIYGGDDALMHEYIHEYYVDDFNEVDDKWSNMIRAAGLTTTSSPKEMSKEDIAKAYDTLSNEEKNNIYLEQLEKAKNDAYKKAQEKLKADELKRKEKEKQRLEEEKKAKEEAIKKGAAEQMSLFDIL